MADIFLHDENSDNYVAARRNLSGTAMYYDYLFDQILKHIPVSAVSMVILDLFAGHGDLANLATKRFNGLCISADLSGEMLKWNREPVKIQCDACALPLAPGSVDAVVICGGLHHLNEDNMPTGLTAIHEVLKRGGQLIFCEPADDNPIIRFIRFAFYRLKSNLGDREKDESVMFTPELSRKLEAAGFHIQSISHIGNIGYALLSQTDILAFTRMFAQSPALSKTLLILDKLVQRLPFNKIYSFAFIMSCQKPGRSF